MNNKRHFDEDEALATQQVPPRSSSLAFNRPKKNLADGSARLLTLDRVFPTQALRLPIFFGPRSG
jgi:hypothetical protein